jgi:thiosulfate dehydrogenase [quinone] large subunit
MCYLPDRPNETGTAYREERVATAPFRCMAGSQQEIPMITQPNPHPQARPAAPDVQHKHRLHLPGRSHLRPGVNDSRTIDTHIPNIALAGLQLLLGYEWLLAGGDKLLLGRFPAQLGGMLLTLVGGGHLVGFFAAILQGLVTPNAQLFGYLIELGETLAGLGLMAAGIVALLRPLVGRSLSGRSATVFMFSDRLLERLALVAAIGAGLLGVSYFFLDGLPAPWFIPSVAFGGSIDNGLFLAVASVILIVSQLIMK